MLISCFLEDIDPIFRKMPFHVFVIDIDLIIKILKTYQTDLQDVSAPAFHNLFKTDDVRNFGI